MAAPVKCDASEIVNKIISDKKNANLLLELEDHLLSANEDIVPTIKAVVKLFTHFLSTNQMLVNTEENEQSPQVQFRLWLCDRYKDFQEHLLGYIVHPKEKIQKCAASSIMKLIQMEGRHPLKKFTLDAWCFPKESFEVVIKYLISEDNNMADVMVHFKLFMKDDVKLYTLKSIHNLLVTNTAQGDIFLHNVFSLLTKVKFPKVLLEDGSTSCNAFISTEGCPKFVLKRKVFSKAFTQAWLCFLKCRIPKTVLKRLLVYLPKQVLPYLNDPLLLTDFLTDSYNGGGMISLLALNGIFYLMQNYNLEYSDFYKKLYSLFTVEVVTSRYWSTFFYLADLFLSSTHLPAYLVAAFTKRLSRLSLMVPPHVILIILTFVGNLLIRHPCLEFLIHKPGEQDVELSKDPYDFDDNDISKCKAMESSLWEIKSQQNHWHPAVSKKAEFIKSPLPKVEWNFSKIVDSTSDEMMNKEFSAIPTEVQLSCYKPCGLFKQTEDHMNDIWTL